MEEQWWEVGELHNIASKRLPDPMSVRPEPTRAYWDHARGNAPLVVLAGREPTKSKRGLPGTLAVMMASGAGGSTTLHAGGVP